jgi:hypothetical protein
MFCILLTVGNNPYLILSVRIKEVRTRVGFDKYAKWKIDFFKSMVKKSHQKMKIKHSF